MKGPIALFASAMLFCLAGCESAFDTRPIAEKYRDPLGKLYAGMTVTEFKQVMPKAFMKGHNQGVDIYEMVWRHTEHMMGDRTTERFNFFFEGGRLVRWGAPGDMPTNGDMTINVRRVH